MRNLKRVLSLALAVVMVIGMMVMTTGAADFVDADKIEYTEAVDVMSALGVMGGYTVDGEDVYDPDGYLTRDQAAKIIAYMMLGKTNADKLIGTGKFDDVPATMWSAGYVEYCANLGIVSGWNNNFAPGDKLMTVQFGKMLLCALGYDADIEGYNNDNWAANISLDMIEVGLDFPGLDLAGYLTREQAAQMALQTLTKDMVKYTNKGSKVTIGGVEIVTGASEAEPYTNGNLLSSDNISAAQYNSTDIIQFAEKYFGNLYRNFGELNGRAGYTWEITGAPASISEFVITDRVLATSNDGTSFANLNDNTKPSYIGVQPTAGTITYYVNGIEVTGDTEADENDDGVGGYPVATDDLAANVTTVKGYIGNAGVIAEFIDVDYDNKYDVVNIISKTVATLTKDAATEEVEDGDDMVIVPGIPTMAALDGTWDVTNVVGYEGLEKGDVVLWYDCDGVRYIEKADAVTGVAVSKDNNSNITVNGKKYGTSGLSNVSYNGGTFADYVNTYSFYLDNSGAIVKAVKETSVAAANYALVHASSWAASGATGLTVENGYAEARLVFADGSYEIVKVAKVGGKTVIAADDTPDATEIDFDNIGIDNKWVTYTINKKGAYELTVKGGAVLDNNSIANNTINFDGGAADVATADTVFVVETGAGANLKFTVYTGIANLPTMTTDGTTAADGSVLTENGVVTYVHIKAKTIAGDTGDYIYIQGVNGNLAYEYYPATQTTSAYYVVKALVNGEPAQIKLAGVGTIVDSTDSNGTADAALAVKTLYKVTAKDDEGRITLLDKFCITEETGISISGGVMKSSSSVLKVTDETVFYYIDTKGNCTVLDAGSVVKDATDKVYVVKANGTTSTAEVVYIKQVVGTVATATIKADTEANVDSSSNITFTENAATHTISAAAGATLKMKVATTDAGATYVVTGMPAVMPAEDGSATVTVVVTSEDGATAVTYTVALTLTVTP